MGMGGWEAGEGLQTGSRLGAAAGAELLAAALPLGNVKIIL